MENEVRQIMLEKLRELSKIEHDDCMDYNDFFCVCSAMNSIAETIIRRISEFSVDELIKELKSRNSVEVTEQERYCIEDAKVIRLINLKVTE